MDNQTKLKVFYLRDLYYYKTYEDRSRITVCILVDEEGSIQARGMAICSPLDQFVRRYGRTIALGRALQSLYHKSHMHMIHPRFFAYGNNQALTLNGLGRYKGQYQPPPTVHERELVSKIPSTV